MSPSCLGRIATSGPFGRGRGKEGQEQAMDNGKILYVLFFSYAFNITHEEQDAIKLHD